MLQYSSSVSIASADAAGVDRVGLETRHLALKGRDEPVDVVVLHARQRNGAAA